MGSYIDNVFGSYLAEREEKYLDVSCSDKFLEPIRGELYKVGGVFVTRDNFLFLLTSFVDNYAYGYKVSGWIDFATSDDFVFFFANQKWVAITECKLKISFRNLTKIGYLNDEDIEILRDCELNNKPFPLTHAGSIVVVGEDCPVVYFRLLEMIDVAKYLFFVRD